MIFCPVMLINYIFVKWFSLESVHCVHIL
jgi:hypothetical protein